MPGVRHFRRRGFGAAAVVGCAGLLVICAPVAAGDTDPQPIDHTHNAVGAPSPVNGAVLGSASAGKPGQAICATASSAASNVNTDCEENGPHNETSIAVDPTDPNHMIGGVNDYQLSINPGGHVSESILSRAHVSFDGGRSWTEYPLNSNSAYQATGDPSVAFDASGHAYYATLGFRFVGATNTTTADVLVNNSGDGGRSWNTVRVAAGTGNATSVGDFLDKEYVAAWGRGNAIVVWGDFRDQQKGITVSSEIYSSVTHDFGKSWTAPQRISGSLTEAFGTAPVVTSDGRIFVSYMNTDDLSTGRDTYYVSEVSPSDGSLVGGPFKVGQVFDGSTDSPFFGGRETYHDSVFRSWAYGNLAADPTNPAHLALVFSDWRDGQIPSPSDPYAAATNSDVIVSQSTNDGRTWSVPTPITLQGDQWMPWSTFNRGGELVIGAFDRSADPANLVYNYTLLTETAPGGTAYTPTPVSTVSSNPTSGDRFFAVTANPAFPAATQFLGDYSNIALIPGTNRVAAYWTDMRNQNCFGGTCGHGEDAYFATAP